MNRKSAGILVYRNINSRYEVFLVHPGGPFWKNKQYDSWSFPKGEFTEEEDPLEAAKREFNEETGQVISGNFIDLSFTKQSSGKMVYIWAVEGDVNEDNITSNYIDIEWPPRSGKRISIPEVDKGKWFDLNEASLRLVKGQKEFIERLMNTIHI